MLEAMPILKSPTQCLRTLLIIFCLTANPVSAETTPADPLPRANDKPHEQIDGVKTHYGSVEVEPGVRLRSFVSHKLGVEQPLNPLLFTQWVSCDSVELRPGDGGFLGALARESNLALIRVERAGTGDSQGPACNELDYETEVAHYTEAFAQLLEDKRIDNSKVYILGMSLGSTTAPLVAERLQSKGYNIEAVMVQGGGALTHLERMINFDRIYLERRPNDVARADIHKQMNLRIAFHTDYLVKDRHPDEIAKDSDAMREIRNDIRGMSATDHYGRPFAWHQQAAQQNFLAAWDSLNAKVLVIYNEYEQFEILHGHKLIVDTVNARNPGTAQLIVQPQLGHSSWYYESKQDAYADVNGERRTDITAQALLRWLGQDK